MKTFPSYKNVLFRETYPKYTLEDMSWVDPMWNRLKVYYIAYNFMTDKMLCDYVMINEPCFRRFILGRSPEKSNSVCEVRLRLTVADV